MTVTVCLRDSEDPFEVEVSPEELTVMIEKGVRKDWGHAYTFYPISNISSLTWNKDE